MAEALFRQLVADHAQLRATAVESAGVGACDGEAASKHAVKTMLRRGVSLKQHKARRVSRAMVESADLVLTMTDGHRQALERLAPQAEGMIFALGQYAGTEDAVADPFGLSLRDYEDCAAQLETLIKRAIARLATERAARSTE
jgi:protein-tyrosine-phosphatase